MSLGHGTEGWQDYHQGRKTTPGHAHHSYENLVNVCLAAEMFKVKHELILFLGAR